MLPRLTRPAVGTDRIRAGAAFAEPFAAPAPRPRVTALCIMPRRLRRRALSAGKRASSSSSCALKMMKPLSVRTSWLHDVQRTEKLFRLIKTQCWECDLRVSGADAARLSVP